MQQAEDFRDESEALHSVVAPLPETAFDVPTQFNGWTINDVLQHLHHFNIMAEMSLKDPDRFVAEYAKIAEMRAERGFVATSNAWLDGLRGPGLVEAWRKGAGSLADAFATADPKQRVKWAGPDMSARSSITARLMETWAHGQEIYDLLGLTRKDTDRIRNIAYLGVNTYGWTFTNRGEEVPEPMPYIRLWSPAGTAWEWGEPSDIERVAGDATAFCQVVCQTRNIADVALSIAGPNAARWMAIAQCFAGPPKDPPSPGTRTRNEGGLTL